MYDYMMSLLYALYITVVAIALVLLMLEFPVLGVIFLVLFVAVQINN